MIKTLAKELTHEYGSGYSQWYLVYFRKFYLTMPDLAILQTRLQNLKWSHILATLRVEDETAPKVVFGGCFRTDVGCEDIEPQHLHAILQASLCAAVAAVGECARPAERGNPENVHDGGVPRFQTRRKATTRLSASCSVRKRTRISPGTRPGGYVIRRS